MPLPILIGTVWALLAVIFALVFQLSLRKGNMGYVDVAWTFAVGFIAIYYAVFGDFYGPRAWLVAALAAVWSLRLGSYILERVGGEAEDGRYTALRAFFGRHERSGFFWFFQAQALAAVLLSSSFVAANAHTGPLGLFDVAGILVLITSVVGETIADRQLYAFRRNPAHKGKTCRIGLWAYSRHPNYFFEWLHWLAYLVIALPSGWWWVALFSPITMGLLITRVTGIPPTEEQAVRSRGDDYRKYQREVSAFVPWFPRKRP